MLAHPICHNEAMSLSIGVDIGGTKIAAGVVDEAGTILARRRRPSPADDSNAALRITTEIVQELVAEFPVATIGIGVPGFVDPSQKKIIFGPNIDWDGADIGGQVATATGLACYLENDANAAAWGEYKFGAASSYHAPITVTIGTGIGGGIIIDGKLLRGASGFAGEIGHMEIVPDGLPCGCGQKGCWEVYGSGNALTATARKLAASYPARAARLLELAGGKVEAISGLLITEAAQQGDSAAQTAFSETGKWIGKGLANLAAIFDPDAFVLSGGVCEAKDLLLAPVQSTFTANLTMAAHRPQPDLVIAQLGNEAGLIGAADLARCHP